MVYCVWSILAYSPSAAAAPVESCVWWCSGGLCLSELSYLCVCLHTCVCVYSWPSPGHKPGEEQAVPGRRGRLLGGGESAGPAGWLPGGQRQQSKYSRSAGSTGEGWAPPAPANGTTVQMLNDWIGRLIENSVAGLKTQLFPLNRDWTCVETFNKRNS